MKKSLFLILSIPLLIAQGAFAESSANVRVNNNVSGSSTSNVQSHTNISVETNGQTTAYTSNKPENIEVKSVNGVSEIRINGELISQSPTQTATKTPTPTDEQDKENEEENVKEEARGIIDQIEELINKLFSLLS